MDTKKIKQKIEVGDYILASRMLNITPENARARFSRKKEDVLNALKVIILNREKLIREYQDKNKA